MSDTIYKRIFNVFKIKTNQIQMIRYVFYKFYVREILMRKQLKYIFFITNTFRLCVGWFISLYCPTPLKENL